MCAVCKCAVLIQRLCVELVCIELVRFLHVACVCISGVGVVCLVRLWCVHVQNHV